MGVSMLGESVCSIISYNLSTYLIIKQIMFTKEKYFCLDICLLKKKNVY